jgi:L-alanine-DL-glutamate epimerase-like enolase superfamily enzyme
MRLRAGSFPFPFRTRFEHAAAARERAANVVVIADDAGLTGLGEGCPRDYVTGETVASALAAIARWRHEGIENVATRDDLEAWMQEHTADIDANPSAFAAVELALLDVFARRAGQSLEAFLGVAPTDAGLRVSAVYGTGGMAKFLAQIALFNLYGMRDAKLKLSGDARQDALRVACLAHFGRVRLDANNLWTSAEDACRALGALRNSAWAVEEPLRARDWAGLAAIGARTGLAIVLDESATRADDLSHLERGPAYVLNARVSKHGGLLRTLSIVGAARKLGLSIVVGAQVGETSILARAGVVAAKAAGDSLVGFEGAFGTRLLVRDATSVSINFGYAGKVELGGVHSLGSGLTPTAEVDRGAA